jgi:AAA-like domain/PDZ domain
MNAGSPSFYVAGGTLRGDARCYVPRQADADLLGGLVAGEFCYVLTSRQMGKSSLMVHTAQRLREQGIAVVVLDLTAIGQNLTAEQWYDGLLGHVGRQLDLEDELEDFWQEHERVGPLQRWMRAIREVVLRRVTKPVTIFVDEIDTVRSLPFSTDEFFAAIRECYNGRSEDPDLARLTFCLLGVATPSDLIRDTRITPFNIGRRIELRDFADTEATSLAAGLGRDLDVGKRLLARVLHWTGGHPYLTQRLCIAVAGDASVARAADVDRLCEELFLSHRARERDDNLLFVRERILRSEVDRAGLLDRCDQVRRGRKVRDDETSPLVSVLRLSGLTRTVDGNLRIRNRIYAHVFDKEWITSNMPDAELRRQKEAFRRGVVRTALVAAAIFAVVGAGIYGYFDAYVWEHRAFFNTYAKRNGVYEGVGSLTPATQAQRPVTVRLTRVGRFGPVVRMESVTSVGELTTAHSDGNYLRTQNDKTATEVATECRWDLVYDRSGHVVYEKAYDWHGNLVWGFVYSPQTPGHGASGHFVGADGYPQAQRHSSTDYVQIDYTPEGFEQFRRYFDRTGKQQPGPDLAYGHRFEYDRRGLTTRRVALDAHDRPMADSQGVAETTTERDALGSETVFTHYDEFGKPTTSADGGYATWKLWNDEFGNWVEWAYFDELGRPTRNKDSYSRVKVEIRQGKRVDWKYFDEAGALVRTKAGYAHEIIQHGAHDSRTEFAFFDENGQPIRRHSLDARTKFGYDDRGRRNESRVFDEAGNPTRCRDGWFKCTMKHDARGNIVEYRYFDEQERPTVIDEGTAKSIFKFDERGNRVESAYFDAADNPARNKNGYAKATLGYDERGNQIEAAYFDEEGKPIRRKGGYHKSLAEFDDRGNQIAVSFFDEFGKPTFGTEGYARRVDKFDDRNNVVETAYFGREGEPIAVKDGNHIYAVLRNSHGKIIEESYFDRNRKPIRIRDGYHKGVLKRDSRDNVIEITTFDESGKPIVDSDGDGRVTQRFDARDNRIERACFDLDGKPRRQKDGSHKWTGRFNESDKMVEQTHFDESGKPVMTPFGCASWRSKFDERGNQIEVAYFDAAGDPTINSEGYHLKRFRFDDRNNRIEMAFFGKTGQPCSHKGGNIHLSREKHDEQGRRIEEAYFDVAGKPTPRPAGYCILRIGYDAHGNETENAYFDGDGKPVRHIDGSCKYVAKYDDQGRPIEVRYFDENDRSVCCANGVAKIVTEYDARGDVSQVRRFDNQERLLLRRARVVILAVGAGSQASKLGIKPGDILVRYDGKNVSDYSSFIKGRSREAPTDDPRELEIERDGKTVTVNVRPGLLGATLQDRFFPADESASARDP